MCSTHIFQQCTRQGCHRSANHSALPHQSTDHTHVPLISSLIMLALKAHTLPHSSVWFRSHVKDSFPVSPTNSPSKFSIVDPVLISCDSTECSSRLSPPSSPCVSTKLQVCVCVCVLPPVICHPRSPGPDNDSDMIMITVWTKTDIIILILYAKVSLHSLLT